MNNNLDALQQAGAEELLTRWRSGLADPVGTGKTRTAILALTRHAQPPYLILAPKLASRVSWPRELALWAPGYTVSVPNTLPSRLTVDITVISLPTFIANYGDVYHWLPNFTVIDEAHKIATPGRVSFTRLSNCLLKASLVKRPLILMTASPITNKLENLWKYYRLMEPSKYFSFQKWKRDRLTAKEIYVQGGAKITVPDNSWKSPEIGKQEFNAHFIRRELKTDNSFTILDVPLVMEPVQKYVYNSCAEKLYIETVDGNFIYTPSTLEKYNVLKQLGSIPAVLDVKAPSIKLEWILEFLDSHTEQVVFGSSSPATFTYLATKLDSFRAITGQTPSNTRIDIIDNFINGNVRCLGLTYPIAESITLTNAHLMVAIDATWVPEHFIQWVGRCSRQGQTKQVLVYTLNGCPMDDIMYENIKQKDTQIGFTLSRDSLLHALSPAI